MAVKLNSSAFYFQDEQPLSDLMSKYFSFSHLNIQGATTV
jgi:hypothetical protein